MEMCLVCLNRKGLGICHNCSNFQPDEQLLERLTMCKKTYLCDQLGDLKLDDFLMVSLMFVLP